MNNRIIKFRAWDRIKDCWMYFSLSPESSRLELDKGSSFKWLCQYTGLKDKHGKEIYEGDVVRWQSWKNKPLADGEVGQIVWNHKGGWMIKENYIEHLVGIYSRIEVIGNIYENPELLKGA